MRIKSAKTTNTAHCDSVARLLEDRAKPDLSGQLETLQRLQRWYIAIKVCLLIVCRQIQAQVIAPCLADLG